MAWVNGETLWYKTRGNGDNQVKRNSTSLKLRTPTPHTHVGWSVRVRGAPRCCLGRGFCCDQQECCILIILRRQCGVGRECGEDWFGAMQRPESGSIEGREKEKKSSASDDDGKHVTYRPQAFQMFSIVLVQVRGGDYGDNQTRHRTHHCTSCAGQRSRACGLIIVPHMAC
jgi:hypothetical protein